MLDIAREALVRAHIDLCAIDAELTITQNGERVRISLEFPDEEEFRFRVAPEDDMRLRLECFNSVDGSTRFVAVLGWLRFVCANGLVLGATLTNFREMHTQQLELGDVGALLENGLRSAREDKATYDRWLSTPVEEETLAKWVDGPLLQAWKLKAATRVFYIARAGHDIMLAGKLTHAQPTTVSVNSGKQVPGSTVPATNAFDVSQALSWVAGQRRDFGDHLQWRSEIPGLLDKLIEMK